MSENSDYNKESGFDQKAFLQIRLHELISTIDQLNFNSASQPLCLQEAILKSIFKNLSSIFATIYSKLSKIEMDEGIQKRKDIREIIKKNPVSKFGLNNNGKMKKLHSLKAIDNISESLLEFRYLLEEFMDKHGFNPSKENAGVSVAKQ